MNTACQVTCRLMLCLLAFGLADSQTGYAQVLLQPHEYGRWSGDWYTPSSSLEDNVYQAFYVRDATASGFTYQFEDRSVPYGPNSEFSDDATAVFLSQSTALNRETGEVLLLQVDPDDAHARVISTQCVLDGCTGFIYRRAVYRAGFDCERAATPIETAICHDELLALGDYEITELYRDLLSSGGVSAASEEEVRLSQRAWLAERNRACVDGNDANRECLARRYSDRLVALARMRDPSLGTGSVLDAEFVALSARNNDVLRNTVVRLAIYPLTMNPDGFQDWVAGPAGIRIEERHDETIVLWPDDVVLQHSSMFFVGSDGGVWAARHTELAEPGRDAGYTDHQREQINRMVGREVRSETDDVPPGVVRAWLDRHPLPIPYTPG